MIRDLNDLVQEINSSFAKVETQLQQHAGSINEMHHRMDRAQRIQDAEKLIATQYSSAQNYTNLILVAGYVALFAAWGATRSDIPAGAAFWALLFMMASATSFILFEVTKMIWTALQVRKQIGALSSHDPVNMLEVNAMAELRQMRTLGRFWVFTLVVTLTTALAALGILAANLILILEVPQF